MKIVFDDGECSITKTPMAFACCDKCDKPSHFSLGFINEPLKNQWDKEKHKYCEHCGALMDWDSLNISKAIESYEEKIRADGMANVIEKLQEYIDTHKRHIFGIGIPYVLDADELMMFLISLANEQIGEKND